MILEKQSEGLLLEEGEVQESTSMQIDAESHIFLMRMLSKFYSDGIGSLVRETASNALDSHRECAVADPIIVGFKANKDGNYEFTVDDFGCGIDDKDVENIISKYGKSTKRLSVNQLGAYGLGFKSPLAYTSAFYFIGRKGGIERKWMLYEAEDEQNKIDLLYESPTTERNGVKIIVPVKYGDKSSFYSKIREQLSYFESVYFDCGTEIQNDFVITRHEHFQWSPLCYDRNLHICLDNVYYPIDFKKLGVPVINFPIGLRFSLSDGIFPLPNRETIKYTTEAKAIILKKIEIVADYFVAKYNESIKDSDDLESIFNYYKTSSRYVGGYDSNSWDVNPLKPYSTIGFVSPKLNGVELLDLQRLYHMKDSLLQEYDKKYEVKRHSNRFKTLDNSNWYRQFSYDQSRNTKIITFFEINKQQKDYIRDTIKDDLFLVRKERTFKLGSVLTALGKPDNYIALLQLNKFPKTEWRQRIKEFQYVQNLISSKFTDLEKLVIPQEWIDGKKKIKLQTMAVKGTNVRRKKLEGEITGKMAMSLGRFVSGKNCKFETTVFQMKDAHKDKIFTIYGGTDQTEIFDKWFTILNKQKVRFVVFSERELKRLKDVDLHNWCNMEEFLKGEHKFFKRAATAYLIHKLQEKFPKVFDKRAILAKISTPLYAKIEAMHSYKNEHYRDGDEELWKAIITLSTEKKLFDPIPYSVYKEVKFILERLTFLNPLLNFGYYHNIDESTIMAIRDLFKYYKQRIDWQHYTLPVNEEMSEEEAQEILELNEEELTN